MEWFEVLKWWLVLEIIGFIAIPLTAWIFRDMTGKGLSLSKILGLMLITYFSWVLTHLGCSYGSTIIGISLLLVIAASLIILLRYGYSFDKKEFITTELLFTAAFLCFVVFRAYCPQIYWTGGEKLMDISFINIILRSTSFPPMDPWLSGEPMQYYYFGYLAVANLIKLSFVPSTIGFNLGVASMFALSATAAYGIGRDLTHSKFFGTVIMAFVVILGNLAGFLQFIVILFIPKYYHIFNVPDADLWGRLSTYYYWSASRVIPDTINEFPFFSFIHGDLHAHMIGIAFQLLMIALLFHLLRQEKEWHVPTLVMITLLLGFMFLVNSWDYPTYAIFFIIVLVAWRIRVLAAGKNIHSFTERALNLPVMELLKIIGVGCVVGICSIVLYLPYYLKGGISHPLCLVTYGQTQLFFYLGVFGILLILIMLFVILNVCDMHYPDMKMVFAGLAVTIIAAYLTNIQILIIILPLIIMSIYCLIKEKKPTFQFIYILILFGALLSLFCELFYIQDSLGISSPQCIRLNTVFKIYIQNWIVWALAAGVSCFYLWQRINISDKRNFMFAVVLILLILGAMAYPVFATYSRCNQFDGEPTLDGAAYLQQQYINEFNAIQWLNNISGTPVVLQSPGQSYRLNTHITAFTGLPTVIGWIGHEITWRNRARTIDERQSEVSKVYTSDDINIVDQILIKYQVKYIYIGMVEGERYQDHDTRKLFENYPDRFELVYHNTNVSIYKVIEQDV